MVHCRNCDAPLLIHHCQVGRTIECPRCRLWTALQYRVGDRISNTGYEVTWADFMSHLTNPVEGEILGKLIEKWFGCKRVGDEFPPTLVTETGEYLIHSLVHKAIQNNPEWQGELYRKVMDFRHGI